MKHDIDVLGFCETCGASLHEIMCQRVSEECPGGTVVDIRRKRAWKALNDLTDAACERLGIAE